MAWYTKPIKAIGSTLMENAALRRAIVRTAFGVGVGAAGGALYGALDPNSSVFGGVYRGAIIGGIAGGLGFEPNVVSSNKALGTLARRADLGLSNLGVWLAKR